ncbi:hypothetical protein [Actinomadura algeriensis]|uniref:Type II secretory pathway pseudopilin PulG n=1 Tax=Actinomadura algeriensis TaxID=1679523 RepID=A0ABR9JK95_9ACTN|nr:hypothetical protein [Actinomadura algeriensis]MBE1530980.1 type II secretory pathway pseudopilin PulG [Actinomadura algeriensis]
MSSRDVDEVGTDETARDATPERAEARAEDRPAKRKRRVRVIEVIDDEDLDEVLEALDAEEEAAEDDVAEAPAEPAKPRASKTSKAAAPAAAKPKPRPARLEPPEDEADDDEDDEPAKARVKPSLRKPAAAVSAEPTYLGMGRTPLIVVVVLVALLASLAIWQWRSASGAASEADERAAVEKVAAAYGDVALNYNATNYQAQMDKAQKLMGGDLLDSFKQSTLPNLGNTFKDNPKLALTSKTNQTFVGSVNGRFATAVVMVDIDITTSEGETSAPGTLLRLSLGKIDGEWKVTKQYASGTDDSSAGQLPAGTPTGGTSGGGAGGGGAGGGSSEAPAPDKSEKPGN